MRTHWTWLEVVVGPWLLWLHAVVVVEWSAEVVVGKVHAIVAAVVVVIVLRIALPTVLIRIVVCCVEV